MPRPSPSPSLSSMLFSASQSGSPTSRSRSGLSSSFSKPSLSAPSTPTPVKKHHTWMLVASFALLMKSPRMLIVLSFTWIRVWEAWESGLWSAPLLLPSLVESGARL